MKTLALDFEKKQVCTQNKLHICNKETSLKIKSNNVLENNFNYEIDKNITEFIVKSIMENNYFEYSKTRRKF